MKKRRRDASPRGLSTVSAGEFAAVRGGEGVGGGVGTVPPTNPVVRSGGGGPHGGGRGRRRAAHPAKLGDLVERHLAARCGMVDVCSLAILSR
jgi:hypothetical protein